MRKAARVFPEPVGAAISVSGAGPDGLPAAPLRGGRLAKALGEPAGDDGVEIVQWHRRNIAPIS